MAVPSGHHIFPFGNSQTQGGTILNNADTSTDRITKALTLIDGVAAAADTNTLPSLSASGIYNVAKVLAGGTFAYSEEGKYVIARSSDTLSGVSNTKLLSMGAGQKIAIAQFQGDFGAKLLTGWRQNQFSWTHTLDSGAKITNMRINWLNAGGTAAASAASLNGTNMWAPGGSSRNGTGAASYGSDVAANPTRAIPGRLVMKSNFVTSDQNVWTASRDGGTDFYKYKPITGM